MKKRQILALLLAALIVSSVPACGQEEIPSEQTDQTGDTTPEVTTKEETDNLPEKDYGGYEFRIWSKISAWYHGYWTVEEQNGETLDDSIYTRARTVEERFNIGIVNIHSDGDNSKPFTAVLAGEDAYDLIINGSPMSFTYAQEGALVSYSDLPYVDLSKPWWDDSINSQLSVGGKHYFAVGDANLACYDYTHALVFNKELYEQMKIEKTPYEMVNDGTWTVDAFAEIIKNVTIDLDGNSKMDASDQYGYLSQAKQVLPGFWIGSEIKTIEKNKDDVPVFELASNQRFSDLFERVYQFTWDEGYWYPDTSVRNDDLTSINMFRNNKGLFLNTTFYGIASLRDMDTDFGVVPYPKYDENQEKYYARTESAEVTCIPVTSPDLERTSIILEALNYESRKTVIPAYYEITLKGKAARDDESAEMLDMIFQNRVTDLGDCVWFDYLRDGLFAQMFMANNRQLASSLASIKESLTTMLNGVVENFSELD